MTTFPQSQRQVLELLEDADRSVQAATVEAACARSQANWSEVLAHITTALAELHGVRAKVQPLAGIHTEDLDHARPPAPRGDAVPF